MGNTGNSLKDDQIREIAAGSITGSYQPLGPAFLRDSFLSTFTNWTNGDIYLSTDGVTNLKKMPSMSGRIYDDKTNDAFRIAGTQWYIKYASVPVSPAGWFALEVEYV
jgi:hypothetical protein